MVGWAQHWVLKRYFITVSVSICPKERSVQEINNNIDFVKLPMHCTASNGRYHSLHFNQKAIKERDSTTSQMFNLLNMLKQGITAMIFNEKQNRYQWQPCMILTCEKGNVLKSMKVPHENKTKFETDSQMQRTDRQLSEGRRLEAG